MIWAAADYNGSKHIFATIFCQPTMAIPAEKEHASLSDLIQACSKIRPMDYGDAEIDC